MSPPILMRCHWCHGITAFNWSADWKFTLHFCVWGKTRLNNAPAAFGRTCNFTWSSLRQVSTSDAPFKHKLTSIFQVIHSDYHSKNYRSYHGILTKMHCYKTLKNEKENNFYWIVNKKKSNCYILQLNTLFFTKKIAYTGCIHNRTIQ